MKKSGNLRVTIPVFILFLSCLLFGQSCSKDNTQDLNLVRVQVETDSEESVRIYGIKDAPEAGVVVQKSYEKNFQWDGQVFSIEARCEDQNTLISIKVWVNNQLKADVSGNQYVTSGDILL